MYFVNNKDLLIIYGTKTFNMTLLTISNME